MGRLPKKVNERYFDEESKTVDELKRMWYVLGAFYPCYNPIADRGIIFRSPHKDLVQIIKNQLESTHAIFSDPRSKNSHWIQMRSAPYLNSRLKEMGLNVPKKERRFPENVPEDSISHFVRGFLDGQGRIYKRYGKLVCIEIYFNKSFLVSLNQTYVQHGDVQHDVPSRDCIFYGRENSLKIHDFNYQDWDYIQEHGLYLPSEKELFNTNYVPDPPGYPNKIAAIERVNEAKELLRQGSKMEEVAQLVGYHHVQSLHRAFEKQTGKTITQWLRKNR